MKLSNKKVSIIVLLITIALTGLVILQTILLKTALKAEEDTFKQNVILALNKVIESLNNDEARSAVMKTTIEFDTSYVDTIYDGTKQMIRESEISRDTVTDSIIIHQEFKKINNNSHNIEIQTQNSGHIEGDDELRRFKYAMIFDDSIGTSFRQESMNIIIDSLQWSGTRDSSRFVLIQTALSQLEQFEQKPIEDRINIATLDTVIQQTLDRLDINLAYSFAVINLRSDSVVLSCRNPSSDLKINSPFRALLFPHDILVPSNYLVLEFPDKETYFYSQVLSLVILTILFLLIIVSCFIYSINLIIKQRSTSNRLTDFINNMTHEFKTPISTIQLASEAIAKDEVMNDREKTRKFNSMILSENKRMKSQVDKILQIATLEEGEYILKQERVNMHELITEVVDSFSILLKQYKGNIDIHLDAENHELSVDKVHMLNIIFNIIENGLKYSNDNPQIKITTANKGDTFILSIQDRGIGIHPDDLKHVFKKYYRVTTGDIHNIKGYGLGLSYVKLIVEAHRGKVNIVSALDKGTEVAISLPVQ